MELMDTPHIDAAIKNNERLEIHLLQAKRAMQKALDERKIWNTDFQDAKASINQAAEAALRPVYEAVLTLYHKREVQHVENFDMEPFSMFFSAPSTAKHLRMLKQMGWFPGKTSDDPAYKLVFRYADILDDADNLLDTLKLLKPLIVKGRKPAENPKEIDLTNTGICSVCLRRQKLNINRDLVAHGYELRWGARNGICYGAGHKAFELSPEGAEAFLGVLRGTLRSYERYLGELQAREPNTMSWEERKRIGFGQYETIEHEEPKGTEKYERLIEKAIDKTESDLVALKLDIEVIINRIQNWELKPLKYGGPETQKRWESKFLNKDKQ